MEGDATKLRLNQQLLYAVQNNDLDSAVLAIAEGADVNYTYGDETLVFVAIQNVNVSMLKMLLEKGSDVNVPSYCFETCTYETPIVTAARLWRTDIVEMLLGFGSQLESQGGLQEGKSALQWAATRGDTGLAELLLNYGADINWIGPYFSSALHYAALAERPDMVQLLLHNGAEININHDGRSPLHIAAVRGNPDIVQHLAAHGCDVHMKDVFGFSPLSVACLRGYMDIVHILLEKLDVEDHVGQQTLNDALYRASEGGHLRVVKHLIGLSADINSTNSQGETPLALVAIGGYRDVVHYLLNNGANMEISCTSGSVPCTLAFRKGNIAVCTELIRHGARIQCNGLASSQVDFMTLWAIFQALDVCVTFRFVVLAGWQMHKERRLTVAAVNHRLLQINNFVEAGNMNSYHTPDYKAVKHMSNWIKHMLQNPFSLRDLCRMSVRQYFISVSQGYSILDKMKKLPLPVCLQHFLCLYGEEPPEDLPSLL